MQPVAAEAKVTIADGLVCIAIRGQGGEEVVLRLPSDLAIQLANRIQLMARKAPASWVSKA